MLFSKCQYLAGFIYSDQDLTKKETGSIKQICYQGRVAHEPQQEEIHREYQQKMIAVQNSCMHKN
jgi:hypothetical protein